MQSSVAGTTSRWSPPRRPTVPLLQRAQLSRMGQSPGRGVDALLQAGAQLVGVVVQRALDEVDLVAGVHPLDLVAQDLAADDLRGARPWGDGSRRRARRRPERVAYGRRTRSAPRRPLSRADGRASSRTCAGRPRAGGSRRRPRRPCARRGSPRGAARRARRRLRCAMPSITLSATRWAPSSSVAGMRTTNSSPP